MRTLRVVALVLLLPPVAGLLYQTASEARDQARYPAPARMLDLVGRAIHVQCAGSGAPTVVFESSAFSSSTEWDVLLPQVARSGRACAYDRAGMGWSDPVSGPRTARDFVDDLHAVLAAAGERPPYILVGHSAGGVLVRAFQAAHPDEVSALVLVDTAPATMMKRWPQIIPRWLQSLSRGRWWAQFGLLRLANPFHIQGRSAALTYRPRTLTAAHQLVGAIRPALLVLPTVLELPTVVLTHARAGDWAGPGTIEPSEEAAIERDWQAAQKQLASGARARLIVAAQSGHMIPAEQPELVQEAIDWARRATRAAPLSEPSA